MRDTLHGDPDIVLSRKRKKGLVMRLDTPLCDFGWKAPDFTLKDPNGVTVTLASAMGANGLLITFICNHCPYVKAIADRLSEDAKILISEGINVVAIMSNDYRNYPADSPANMQLFARQHDFPFPYTSVRE